MRFLMLEGISQAINSKGARSISSSASDVAKSISHSGSLPTHRRSLPVRRHRVFSWVVTEAGKENYPLPKKHVLQTHGIQESVLLGHMRDEVEKEQDLFSLPWSLLLLATFTNLVLAHELMSTQNAIQKAISFDVSENANFGFTAPGHMGHKNFDDVNYFADFWSFMHRGLMPLIFSHNASANEEADVWDRHQYLRYSHRLSGVHLTRELAEASPCKNPLVARAFRVNCSRTPSMDWDLRPDVDTVQATKMVPDLDTEIWLDKWDEETQRALTDLEATDWLNPMVSRVQVSFMVYHGTKDFMSIYSLHFLFSREGHIWKIPTQVSMQLEPYMHVFEYIVDFMFFGHLGVLLVLLLLSLGRDLRATGVRQWSAWKNHFTGWRNVVDWATVAFGIFILVEWIHRLHVVWQLQRDVIDAGEKFGECIGRGCSEMWRVLSADIAEASAAIRVVHRGMAFGGLVMLVRLFKAFAAQPRLSLVTETLRVAGADLMHLLIVFAALFASYAVMGVALFGKVDERFANFRRAANRLFLLIVLGDLDYEAAVSAGRFPAFMFFATFIVLVVFVLLSMLIAILMDVYTEVKERTSKAVYLWVEMHERLHRKWKCWRGVMIPLDKVLADYEAAISSRGPADAATQAAATLEPGSGVSLEAGSHPSDAVPSAGAAMGAEQASDDPVISLADFLGKVQGLSKTQAERLMLTALDRFMREAKSVELVDVDQTLHLAYHQMCDAKQKLSDMRAHAHPGARPAKLAEAMPLAALLGAAELRVQASADSKTHREAARSGLALAVDPALKAKRDLPQSDGIAAALPHLVKSALVVHTSIVNPLPATSTGTG